MPLKKSRLDQIQNEKVVPQKSKNQLAHPQTADSHWKSKEYGFLTPARVKCGVQVSGFFPLNFERTLEIEEVKSLNGRLSG